jgi:hypothetical protein
VYVGTENVRVRTELGEIFGRNTIYALRSISRTSYAAKLYPLDSTGSGSVMSRIGSRGLRMGRSPPPPGRGGGVSFCGFVPLGGVWGVGAPPPPPFIVADFSF